ncbi:hypothetical protein ACWDUN_28635 [Mycobacterium sp. NPDC003323]
MAEDRGAQSGGGAAETPWYEESWAVVTAGVAGLLVIGVLIYAVVQTAQNSVDPSDGPGYYSTYPTSTSSSTTTSRTIRSSTTTTTTTSETTITETATSETATSETTATTETTTTETTEDETTEDDTTTTTVPTLGDDNPFILNPFDEG